MRTKGLTNSEVLHRWAQQSKDYKDISLTNKSKNITAKNKYLYRHSSLVAYFYKNNVIILNGLSGGSFGTGLSTYEIRRAVSSKFKVFLYDKLYDFNTLDKSSNLTDSSFTKWYTDELLASNSRYFQQIATIMRYVNKEGTKIDFNKDLKFKLLPLPSDIEKGNITKFKSIIINTSMYVDRYIGWSKYYSRVSINTSVSKLLSKNDLFVFFTKDQIKEINFQIWREKYGRELSVYDNLIPKEKIRGVYNDPVAKIKREELVVAYNINKIERQHLKNQAEHIKDVYKYYNKLSDWLIGDSSRFNNNTSVYTFSSIKLIQQRVITSLNVIITIEQAKLAYNLFKRYKQDDNSDINLTDKGFVIDGYKVKGIRKYTYNKPTGLDLSTLGKTLFTSKPPDIFDKNSIEEVTELALIIGCHIIPESEIIRFINDNNLNWNE